jgi:hypothetical protein
MPAVQFLHLSDNQLSGQLPASWGHQGVWPQLSALHLQNNLLEGPLPPQWASGGAFPTLQVGLFPCDPQGKVCCQRPLTDERDEEDAKTLHMLHGIL